MVHVERVAATLSAWPFRARSLTPMAGGWNSTTWLAVTAEGRYVAKLVDDLDAPALVSGLQGRGVPRRTRAGLRRAGQDEGWGN